MLKNIKIARVITLRAILARITGTCGR